MFDSTRLFALIVVLGSCLIFMGCGSGHAVRGKAVIQAEYSRKFFPQNMVVKLIDEKEMTEFAKKKSDSIKSSVDGVNGQRTSLREGVTKIGKDIADGRRQAQAGSARLSSLSGQLASASSQECEYDDYYQTYDCSSRDNRVRSLASQIPSAKGQIAAGNSKAAAGEIKLTEQNKMLQGVEKSVLDNFMPKSLLENLPNPAATGTVNSEGFFDIEVPKGRYALVASGDKNDLGIEEKLLWIFWIDVAENADTKIELNKDNVLYSDFENNVFKISDFIEKTSSRQ